MNLDLMRIKPWRIFLFASFLMLTTHSSDAALGLPDNPKDPPPPPSSAGNLFGNETVVRFNDSDDENTAAEGKPEISGVPEEDGTVTALKGTIMDPQGTSRADNGETGFAYRYQWVRVDGNTETDIANATSVTYVLTRDDVGKRIKVKVWFTDDADHPEGPMSSDSHLVLGHLLISNMNPPPERTWYAGGRRMVAAQPFTTGSESNYVLTSIGVRSFSAAIAPKNKTLVTLNASDPDDPGLPGKVLAALKSPKKFSASPKPKFTWRDVDNFTAPTETILLKPNTTYWAVLNWGVTFWHQLHLLHTVSFQIDAESRADWSIPYPTYATWRGSWDRGYYAPGHALRAMIDVRGTTAPPGLRDISAATGAPTISGRATEGNWLKLSTSAISDNNGTYFADLDVDGHAYTYQWVRVDGGSETDIAGATYNRYLTTAADAGKKIKVKVWFSDDVGHAEGPLTSAAFPTTGTIEARPAQVLVENTSLPSAHRLRAIFAQRFRTGHHASGYSLYGVELRTGPHSDGVELGQEDASDFRVRIYKNGANSLPGRQVHTLSTGLVAADSVVSFPAPEGATLSPSTNYWVVVSNRSGSSKPTAEVYLATDARQNSDLSDGWSIDNRTYGKDNRSDNWGSYQNTVLQIKLLGQPLP